MWGLDLKPEYPKKPDILIENNFDKTTAKLTQTIFKIIKKLRKVWHNVYLLKPVFKLDKINK